MNNSVKFSIFGNFRIDSQERLQRMKDSFVSFESAATDNWVINIRGEYAEEAIRYLKAKLGESAILSSLETGSGWFHDSREIVKFIKNYYILFWIEDHICIGGADKLIDIVSDMREHDIEYLGYSWYGNGSFRNEFNGINLLESSNLFYMSYNNIINKSRQINAQKIINSKSYIISACGIFSKSLFLKIINCRRPLLRRWPKETPFDFEKRWDDTYLLPVRYGIPKFELFCSIDDNNKYPNSSLISRGLYPNRVSRREMLAIANMMGYQSGRFNKIKKILRKFPFLVKLKSFLTRFTYHV